MASYTVRELIDSLSRADMDLIVAVEYGLGATPVLGWHAEYGITDRDTDQKVDLLVLEVQG